MTTITQALIDYAIQHPQFTAEEAWVYVEGRHGDLGVFPLEPNQKGGAFRRTLVEPGHVVPVGMSKAKNKSARGRQVVVWKSLLCTSETEVVDVSTQLAQIRADINEHKITVLEGLKKAYVLGSGVDLI